PHQPEAAKNVGLHRTGSHAEEQIAHRRENGVVGTRYFTEEILREGNVFLEAEDLTHRTERCAEVEALVLAIRQLTAVRRVAPEVEPDERSNEPIGVCRQNREGKQHNGQPKSLQSTHSNPPLRGSG